MYVNIAYRAGGRTRGASFEYNYYMTHCYGPEVDKVSPIFESIRAHVLMLVCIV